MTSNALIIAEAGVNHNGELSIALELVEAARAAGADIIKFQTFTPAELAVRGAPLAEYQSQRTQGRPDQLAMLEELSLKENDWRAIASHCEVQGIEFLSSAFDWANLLMLVKLGMKRIKVASGEITNLPYLRRIASLDLPVIMSTGMADLDEVLAALDCLGTNWLNRNELHLLHCTTQYPAPYASVNLRAMETLARVTGREIGYSDHTASWEVSLAAVALGAKVIEKHITLDPRMEGPDHAASLSPGAFSEMVAAIRNVELCLGDGVKQPHACEVDNREKMRRSLVATQSIKYGEEFTELNVGARRPGTGVSPMEWDRVIGQSATQDFSPGEQIQW